MNVVLLLLLLFFIPLSLLLAWFAVSSCLGDDIRAQWSGRTHTTPVTYGRSYAHAMGGQAGWEQIEMQDMLEHREDD